LDTKAINWLLKNAGLYGFAWELQSEPWHLVYVAGDKIPPAVNQAATGIHDDTLNKDLQAAMELKLKKGSGKTKEEKAAVIWLQTFLNKADLKVLVDGDFGAKTEEAVKAFQRKNISTVGLADGVVTKKTWEALTK
jgi:peptidoglycan hydrolase-like protein with peptidoglycan-binding domain